MVTTSGYYEYAREERQFCALVAHLLMQKGPNLASFLKLCDARAGDLAVSEPGAIREAEVYLEFSLLRDNWDRLGKENAAKRALIFDLMARVTGLERFRDETFPDILSDFNERFMGAAGLRIKSDVVSPGRWSVLALAEHFGSRPEEFRTLCMFKWSFNIKPDLVVLVPGRPLLSIEAKLESGEGRYPTRRAEVEAFDRLFGAGKGHVGQVELQQFMFRELLNAPCQSLMLVRDTKSEADLTWQEVFAGLDVGSSIDFVGRLIRSNRHLTSST